MVGGLSVHAVGKPLPILWKKDRRINALHFLMLGTVLA